MFVGVLLTHSCCPLLAAAAREDKRRLTAPGDLTSGPSGTGPSIAGPSATSPVGPLTAAAVRRPSLFSRRAAVAAAASAASAVGQQPLVAVPSGEYEAPNIQHSTEAGQRLVASTPTLDPPAADYHHLPPPLLATGMGVPGSGLDTAGAATPASVAALSVDAPQDSRAGGADDAVSLSSLGPGVGADATLAPVLLSQGTACDWSVVLPAEALGLRYGTVKRSRLGRVGISIPYPGTALVAITPGAAAAGAAAGASVGGILPAAAAGSGAGLAGSTAAAAAQGAATPGGQAAAGAGEAGRPRAPPARSIKFKHVRFNRMHARLTYEGPALSIRNFGLVLDNRVYRNIDGGWKTVLNRSGSASSLPAGELACALGCSSGLASCGHTLWLLQGCADALCWPA